MTNIFMFTASNPAAQHHWRDSIASPVRQDLVYANFSPSQHKKLAEMADSAGGFYCWGATPGQSNIPTWERLQPEDYVLGYYKKNYRCIASVLAKFQNPDFARKLWGTDDGGNTWEYMYFLTKPTLIFTPAKDVEDIFGGHPQGFKRVADSRTSNIQNAYGSIERFFEQRLVQTAAGVEYPLDKNTGALPDPTPSHELSESKLSELGDEEASTGAFDPTSIDDAREMSLRSIVIRRGQPQFRARLLLAYGETCAITGFDCVSALEAAHIIPYKGEHTNDVSNGLLLRSDIHTLFDCGHIAVDTASMTIVMSTDLAKSRYKYLDGKELRMPRDSASAPSIAALDQHRSNARL